jgi:hypothetical protein
VSEEVRGIGCRDALRTDGIITFFTYAAWCFVKWISIVIASMLGSSAPYP